MEGQATNAKPSLNGSYGTPRWHDMDHAIIESLQLDHSPFSFLESRRTAFLPHPQDMQAKANGMARCRVITYDM